MTSQIGSDIVRHALVDVLTPASATLTGKTYRGQLRQHSTGRLPPENTFLQTEAERPPLHVSVLEQLTPTTLSVYWSDPCLGRYADQVWRIGLAPLDSFCVLTGRSIRRGDSVFRPRVRGSYSPANRHRMILASAVSDYLRNRNA